MKIFADFHHAGLYASFIHLFETRLGHEVYRPIGKTWFINGFWKVAEPYNNNEGTIAQYLGFASEPEDGTRRLNDAVGIENGAHIIHDEAEHVIHKAIAFEQFCDMKFDVIIASIPQHIETYRRLIKEHMPDAKLVYHIGNIGWGEMIDKYSAPNIMASIAPQEFPRDKNVVFYRQEFDLHIFKSYWKPPEEVVTGFVHPNYLDQDFAKLKELLTIPIYNKGYSIRGVENIAHAMRNSMFGYHKKPGGDGYGHIIHNWMAVGRPVIVNLNDYKDKLAGELLQDWVTCIDMDKRTIEEVAEIVNDFVENKYEYNHLCQKTVKRFKEVVDFEEDARKVQHFLEKLI